VSPIGRPRRARSPPPTGARYPALAARDPAFSRREFGLVPGHSADSRQTRGELPLTGVPGAFCRTPPPRRARPRRRREKQAKLTATLKEAGLTKEQAQRILSRWEEQGVKGPDDLGQLWRKEALGPLAGLLGQTATDAFVAYVGVSTGLSLSGADAGPLGLVGQVFFYGIGLYYLLTATVDVALVASYLNTLRTFQVDSGAYLDTVQGMAGRETGLDLVDRARRVQQAARLQGTLGRVADILR